MKTFTKILVAAGAGYALRAYVKRDTIYNNDALKHSVDRRISVEGTPSLKTHIGDYVFDMIKNKTYAVLYGNHASATETPYNRRYGNATRYSRFGRRDR